MDKLIGKVPKKDIIKFNKIRKYLKYFHLKEISSLVDRNKFITGIPYESTCKCPESPMIPGWKLIWLRLINKYLYVLTNKRVTQEQKRNQIIYTKLYHHSQNIIEGY